MTGRFPTDHGDLPVGRPGVVVRAHAELTSRAQVLADRRALYRLAAELTGALGPAVPDEILDHPVSRHRIGEVLAGRTPAAALRLPTADELTDDRGAGSPIGIADDPHAGRLLAPALASVAAEAAVPGGTVGLITRADGERYDRAAAEVRSGLRRAAELVPELFADLAGHVTLIAVLDPGRSGAVVSASSRHVPGLLLVRPGGALEVAESIVHEAAHQRLFDLVITRDLLRGESDGVAGFRPSWRPTTWPVEQTLAAFHAYACLTELADALGAAELETGLGPHSVLPSAARRAREIGQWLYEHAGLLGADADRLVRKLLDRPAAAPASAPAPAAPAASAYRAQDCRIVPAGDGRCLVGVPGSPPRLFWLDGDAVTVLQILRSSAGPAPVERIAGELSGGPGSGDAFARVFGALDTLVLAELAAAG